MKLLKLFLISLWFLKNLPWNNLYNQLLWDIHHLELFNFFDFFSFNIFIIILWNSSLDNSLGYTSIPCLFVIPFAKWILFERRSKALIPFCASNKILVRIACLLPFFTSDSKNFLNGKLWWSSIWRWIFSKISTAFTKYLGHFL